MPNGKPGDHPITDLMVHGRSSMPPEIEDLVRALWGLRPPNFNPGDPVWDDIYARAPLWVRGKGIKVGMILLQKRIADVL